jgi:hypothetical protein
VVFIPVAVQLEAAAKVLAGELPVPIIEPERLNRRSDCYPARLQMPFGHPECRCRDRVFGAFRPMGDGSEHEKFATGARAAEQGGP